MEAGDPSVSLDLMVRTLLAMGATREDVAGAIAPFQHQGYTTSDHHQKQAEVKKSSKP
jgi:hypothetical protein